MGEAHAKKKHGQRKSGGLNMKSPPAREGAHLNKNAVDPKGLDREVAGEVWGGEEVQPQR